MKQIKVKQTVEIAALEFIILNDFNVIEDHEFKDIFELIVRYQVQMKKCFAGGANWAKENNY